MVVKLRANVLNDLIVAARDEPHVVALVQPLKFGIGNPLILVKELVSLVQIVSSNQDSVLPVGVSARDRFSQCNGLDPASRVQKIGIAGDISVGDPEAPVLGSRYEAVRGQFAERLA